VCLSKRAITLPLKEEQGDAGVSLQKGMQRKKKERGPEPGTKSRGKRTGGNSMVSAPVSCPQKSYLLGKTIQSGKELIKRGGKIKKGGKNRRKKGEPVTMKNTFLLKGCMIRGDASNLSP